jgi:ribonuclease HepT-like protein
MLSRIVQPSKPTAKKPLVRDKGESGVTSSIFHCRYSVFFWHLLLLEQMTKEVPGIRPAVISTETGIRLDEYRRFRHVVRNVYTHNFDAVKLGKLVNSAPELFARTKAEVLAFAAFLEH